ncbi:MAG TPA: oligosaccharide flippase family protein [Gaiellaceae bacterium]|nr:oligosaccharide flippase family protein [Gaiellaceae bacterium]
MALGDPPPRDDPGDDAALTAPPTAEDREPRAAGILSNTLYGLLAQASTSVFTAILTLYLVRALGPKGFGTFSLALSIGGITLLLSDLSISNSAARFVAESRRDRGAIAAVAATALGMKLAIGTVVSAALFLLASPIARAYGQHGLVWPLRGIALTVFAQSLMGLYIYTFTALRRVSLNFGIVFFESLFETTASIALVALGGGAAGAAFGRAIGNAIGAAAGIIICIRVIGRGALSLRTASASRMREIARYARPLFVTNSAYALYSTIDVLLIGALLSTASVGLFSAPLRLMAFLSQPGTALSGAVAPRLAREGDTEPDVRPFNATLRWMVILQALLIAPIVVWARPIVAVLLGPDFSGAAVVVRALAPAIFLSGISPILSVGVNYLGAAGRRIPIVLGALAINTAIDLALLRQIGVVAAAIGTSVAYSVYVAGHFQICRRMIDIPLRPLLVTFARSMAAAGAMAGVLFLVGTRDLSIGEWIAGALVGSLCAFVVLFATGEVSVKDLRSLARLRHAAE